VNNWKTPQFARDLATLRRGESIISPKDGTHLQPSEFIVVEEPMGRGRVEMAPLIDFVAVIDTPLEIALARRLLRDTSGITMEEISQATQEQLAEGIERISNYLRHFLNEYLYVARDVYITVLAQVRKNCDLVLDGMRPVDELAQQLVSAVKDKPGTRATTMQDT
jgi:uridine kinase